MMLTLDIDAYKAANGHVPLIIGREYNYTYTFFLKRTEVVKLIRAEVAGVQIVVENKNGYRRLVNKNALEWKE